MNLMIDLRQNKKVYTIEPNFQYIPMRIFHRKRLYFSHNNFQSLDAVYLHLHVAVKAAKPVNSKNVRKGHSGRTSKTSTFPLIFANPTSSEDSCSSFFGSVHNSE